MIAFRQQILVILLVLLRQQVGSFPTCDEGDLTLEQTCEVFGDDDPLTFATIDFQFPAACIANICCDGFLAGVRCFTGEGFLSLIHI